MTDLRLLVINSSTREGRFSDHVAQWAVEGLRRRTDAEVDLLDLRDHPLPIFDGPSPVRTPREYRDDAVRAFAERIDRADGFVVLTAEYNHGYTGVLKNALDWTFVEWNRKPMSFIGWGNVGGARAIEQLREVCVELEVAPLRHAVHILPPQLVAVRESGTEDALTELDPRLDLLADGLVWWAGALQAARRAEAPGLAVGR